MSIISTIKSINSPMKSEFSNIIMAAKIATINPIKRKNITMKGVSHKKFPTRVALQDNFVSNGSFIITNDELQEEVEKIKQITARKLPECCNVEELVIIDAIQRLNLEYYFRHEIHDALRKHHRRFVTMAEAYDLHDTALCFRLLRQHEYNVSSDTFSKFMDKNDKFKKELENDMKGLISLFEASHLKLRGENILDYACEFSRRILTNFNNVEASEANIISDTLSLPYHENLPKFSAMDFLQKFEISMKLLHNCREDDNKWMYELSYLAQINITRDQLSIKDEINEICRWWEALRLPKKLKLARSEPAKWHMWSVACLPDTYMAELRLELTKAISFIYIFDDIFDIYGKLEDLTLFTETVIRWEIDRFDDRLPDYMIVCLRELFDTTNKIINKIYSKNGSDAKYHLRKVWAEFCSACLVQANWFSSGYMPTVEEYMKNEVATTGSYIVHVHIFFLLGEVLNDTNFSMSSHPEMSSSAAMILRLWDDLGSSKDEHQICDGSVLDCYMNEHEGSSSESARQYVLMMISDAWSRLNEALVSPSPFSDDFKAAMANFARTVPIMYKYDDKHRLVELEKLMRPLVTS